jgi:hypothetical protein
MELSERTFENFMFENNTLFGKLLTGNRVLKRFKMDRQSDEKDKLLVLEKKKDS